MDNSAVANRYTHEKREGGFTPRHAAPYRLVPSLMLSACREFGCTRRYNDARGLAEAPEHELRFEPSLMKRADDHSQCAFRQNLITSLANREFCQAIFFLPLPKLLESDNGARARRRGKLSRHVVRLTSFQALQSARILPCLPSGHWDPG